jgi:hypothetical protein
MKSPKAPQIEESGLEAQSDGQRKNSVYDFLYHDARRVSSFLAQFHDYGHLLSVKSTESVGQSSATKSQASVSGTLPLVATAQGGVDRTITDDERDSAERTYDPFWANALELLNFLEENELIQRNINQARIGQFVLVSGSLSLFDLGLFRKTWDLPTVKKLIIQAASLTEAPPGLQNRHDRRKPGVIDSSKSKAPSQAEVALELMTIMPHTAMAAIRSGETSAWCTLLENWLTVPTSDLLLKHGAAVSGVWNLIGVLDAFPDDPEIEIKPGLTNRTVTQMEASASICSLGLMFANIVLPLKQLVGRPEKAFGVTPLLIFREISG